MGQFVLAFGGASWWSEESAPLVIRTHKVHPLRCRNCGQTGHLWLAEHGHHDWSFTTVGFIGLAVNRHNPPNSVLRCNGCGSPQVSVDPTATQAG